MSAPESPARREILLFVYDAWMSELPAAAALSGARLVGPAATEAHFDLVDLGTHQALVHGGATSVKGEVHALAPALLASLDIEKGHPLTYKRVRVRLDDGREVEAYTLHADQVRGRRRIRSGDYRVHLTPTAPQRHGGAWSQWARGRGRS